MKVLVKKDVGVNLISMQSGTLLYEKISSEVLSGNEVELDFEGVELFATPFFNASIGLLLKDIDLAKLQSLVTFPNLSKNGLQLLNHVIKNAIDYYDKDSGTAELLKEIKIDPEDQ